VTARHSELSKRVATGVIGGAALLALIIFGTRVGVALLAALLSLGMLYEMIEMTFALPDKAEKRVVLLGISWLVAFVNFWVPRAEYELLLVSFLGLFTYFLFSAERHRGEPLLAHFRELIYSIFGLLYLGFLPLFLPLIRDSANGVHWTIVFLLIVWAGDTGAYFAGKKYGHRKLYPLISPKKTVEGGLGGLAAGLVVALLYKLIFFQAMSVGAAFVISLVVGTVAAVGDLCESFLKRAHDTKDSGTILPGHGGFLDRFDGVVFSLPVMYGCIRIFG
jgi:phosphatidate cytidylyltransferase